MKNIIQSIGVLVSITMLSLLFASTNKETVTVKIENVKEVKGTIFIGAFESEHGFPEDHTKMYYYKIYDVTTKDLRFEIPKPSTKEMAVVVFQDVNRNSEMDKNMIGYPLEPYAFSNNIKPTFKAPSFSDCAITNFDEVATIKLIQ